MQKNNMLKLGLAALLSIWLVACSSTGSESGDQDMGDGMDSGMDGGMDNGDSMADGSAADMGDGMSAEEMDPEVKQALATTVFYFDFDKSDLKPEARAALVHHANRLKANPGMKIRLEGHADERGTREYNLALGERRAQSVERYLLVQGVSGSQLETISYGEESPVDTGTTEAAYARNRRVEMH